MRAPCSHACPAGIDVPRYVRLIAAGRFADALAVIREKIPFPSVCGLVCFHPCEAKCRRTLIDEAIAIRALKRAAAERDDGRWKLKVKRSSPTGKRVAIVGSGPAGLTAAYYLARKGHAVTVYEELPEPGGMMRYGIPEYRLPREILDREIAEIEAAGVEIRTNTKIESLEKLFSEGVDAVFLALGAHRGVKLGIPGEEEVGLLDCVDFLRRVKLGYRVELGERVAVIGGVNAAIDAARTALRLEAKQPTDADQEVLDASRTVLRLGAKEVRIIYRRSQAEMPASPEEVREALEEGIQIDFLTAPVRIAKEHGKIRLDCIRMRLGEPDASGRRRPEPIPGSEFSLYFDRVISAIGEEPEIPEGFGLPQSQWKTLSVDVNTLMTARPKVFAGGDVVTGPASVIEAIAAGRQAASAIDRALGGDGHIEEILIAPDEDAFFDVEEGERPRVPLRTRPISERLKGFAEVELSYSAEEAQSEARRCLMCDLPLARAVDLERVTLTIDGVSVTTERGRTVLEAAQQAGIYIPTLCYHADLEPYGGCWLCVVEVEGLRGLPTACTLPAQEGMIVRTESERINAMRRARLQSILADHEGDCVTCRKNGDCQLQEVSSYLGVDSRPVRFREPRWPVDASNPFFTFDPNKCILCGICMRTCAEIQGAYAIHFAWRGSGVRIAPFGSTLWVDSPCESCGECVVRCPTGALVPKNFQRASRYVKSVCPYCGVGCTISLGLRGDRIVSVEGDRASPVNDGRLCLKGRFGIIEAVHSPNRLKRPLVKRDGKFVEASWDEALDLIAQKFREIKARYGPESLGVIASARVANEANYLAQKLARAVFGTNKVDCCARICHAPSVHGLLRSFGSGAMTNSIAEIGNAHTILLIGSNTTEAHPTIGSRIRRAVRRGAKLIVADPREIELAKIADVHLPLRPGTDIALANAMAHHIIVSGLHNEKFIKERTEGFEEFWAVVQKYTPEYAEKITGVPADKIRQAAELYARGQPGMIVYCLGVTEHRTGVISVQSIANLALITGFVGQPSTGVNPLRGQNNVQGACDMGALPEFLPGYQRWDNPEHVKKFEEAWGVQLPKTPGHYPLIFCSRMWDDILKGNLHGLYIIGEDVALTEANIGKVRKALQSLDFLVVQELFMTPTAELAHVVLPAAGFAEIDGTFTDSERRVQRVRKAIEPPGECKPDWQIVCEISNRMGYPMNYRSAEEVFEELRRLMPIYGGINYKRLDENIGLQWPCPTEDHPGTRFLHKEK
ncbi:MAG: formate dehydrogenase subunit alpha, partial [Candidatus Bipolaricaulota bacterium]|nr:formate dehydrogenase subunit alpha [Candidatus Bipolaricaulota bacterium]